MKFRPILLILSIVYPLISPAYEEWVIQKFDTSFALLHYNWVHTSHFWNKHSVKKPAFNRFKEHTYSAYIQYGLTSQDTLGLLAGYSRIDESLNGRAMGWIDSELDWKHLVWSCPQKQFFTQVIVIIPSSTAFKPALRYGRFGIEGALHYRQVFFAGQQRLWYELKGGYRAYTGYPSDQLRAYARLAYNPWQPFDLIGSCYLDYGLFNGRPKVNQSLIAYAANYRLLTLQLEGVLYLWGERFSLTVGGFWHAWGANAGTGGGALATLGARF